MGQGTAAVVAAGIAFGASLISLVVSTMASSRGAAKVAYRQLLEPSLGRLGKAVHEAVASATVTFTVAEKGKDDAAWIEAGRAAEQSLKELRMELRYPLFGLDEGLRTLSRVPTWAATYKGHESGKEFLSLSSKLGASIDRAVAKAYAAGRPPGRVSRWRVGRNAKRVRNSWGDRFQTAT